MTDLIKQPRREDLVQSKGRARTDQGFVWGMEEGEAASIARQFVARLLRRGALIFAIFVIVVVPAAIGTWLTTPLYRSTALIQVNSESAQVMPYRDVAEVGVATANFENYMGTQEQILRSGALGARVAARLESEFAGQPIVEEIPMLGSRFDVRKIEKSQIFEIAYRATEPESAATIVNLFAEEHIRHNFEMRQATRLKAEQELKKELLLLEQRLQVSEKELMAYAQSHDIVSLEQGQVDPLQARLAFFNQEVSQKESARALARVTFETLRGVTPADMPLRLVSDQLRQLEGRALQLEQELTTLRSTFGENWPVVIEKRNEAALVREQVERERLAALASHREQAELDLQSAEATYQTAVQSLAEQKALVNRFHEASTDYSILRREVDTNRNLYDGLLERLRQTGVLAGSQFGNIQVVEPGRANPAADSPKVVWNLLIAAMLGLALGVALAIGLDAWDTSVATPEELEQLGLGPHLGSVPVMFPAAVDGRAGARRSLLPGRRRSGSGAALPAQGQLPFEVAESMRAICASLLLSRSDTTPRVLVVTSATHDEGKTTAVGHLGRAFADAGVKTLLIEADLRKPDLSRAFSVGNESGLSLYLAGHVSPWPKIHETDVPNLFVAAAGPVPPNPAALLHSDRMARFLDAAAAEYQMVILDVPPLLSMADARIVGRQADGVVLVVRAGRTGANLVRRARRMLDEAGANMLGLVLNAWEPDRAALTAYGHYHPTRLESSVR